MIYYVSSTAFLYVLVAAEDEATARSRGQEKLVSLHAERFKKYGLVVPVELVCVREAEENEIALDEYQRLCEAQERLAMARSC